MHTCFLQCDTPQIRSRIFHELTEKKLLTNDNTPSSSLNQKPSTNAKSNSYLSSDSVTLKTGQQSSERERSRLVTPQSLKMMVIV